VKKIQLLGLSILSGILLWASWPASSFTFLIFFAWVPLLMVADNATKRISFFLYSFVALLIWNTLTTWWIWNSTDVGTIAAILTNSLLMCIPCWGYHVFKNRFSKPIGYISFITSWMLFEYVHLNWQISWPWLTLGNVFAQQIQWVQWYEYTGVSGGTLWLLLVNIFIFDSIKKYNSKGLKAIVSNSFGIIALLGIPLIFSFTLLKTTTTYKQNDVVIVQPNIDPYQKFESGSVAGQIDHLIELSKSKIDTNTSLLIWPETALAANVEISEITTAPIYQPVFNLLRQYPNLTLVTGIETYKILGPKKTTSSARQSQQGFYYDSYNAAIALHNNDLPQIYIKSKLVPGVETLPSFLNILAPVFEQFGGTTGGYAIDTASHVFKNAINPFVAAPIICYESIYGAYVASYVKKGANLITIITNDGWWGNTPGHRQHLQYAKLRAIETRRYVARSANTGISAVIDDYGNILETKGWNISAVIKHAIPVKDGLTFYVRHGDYLYVSFSFLAILLILWNFILWFQEMKKKKTKLQ
jgi:apolipoprotein N-acyltransferase